MLGRSGRTRTTPALDHAFDAGVAGLLLVVLSPLLAALALLVRGVLGPPVLFRQVRPGLDARPFTLYKFRTMSTAAGPGAAPLSDAHRMTTLGRVMRAASLDELPELWNVVAGDMALVGPRPLLMQYLPLYTREQFRRHDVRPGITGWAQVNGRNALTWEEKFALDTWYVKHRSFWLDMRILWRTFWRVMAVRGISQAGHVTAEPFAGSRPTPTGDR